MNRPGNNILTLLSMATLWVAMSFASPAAAQGKLVVALEHYVGMRPLQLDTVSYTNDAGQSFTVTKFRYYLGNIHLQKEDGEEVAFTDYYLVDEDEPDSKRLLLNSMPTGSYTGISFIIGVDSLHNCNGAQEGALDPANGMYWAWNTGYIFLKLEGKSPASTSPGHIFEYHIGGYKQPNNCIREVTLKFAKPLDITTTAEHELHLKVDAAEVLKTPTTVNISKLSSVTDFHNATTIANNYMDMFSILAVQ